MPFPTSRKHLLGETILAGEAVLAAYTALLGTKQRRETGETVTEAERLSILALFAVNGTRLCALVAANSSPRKEPLRVSPQAKRSLTHSEHVPACRACEYP